MKAILCFLILLLCQARVTAAEIPKVPVPKSPFIAVVYRYADTMLKNGRDFYGPQKTGLFLSALDRDTLAPLTTEPPLLGGIRDGKRPGLTDTPLLAANPQHDENFLRLLYTLSELTGKPHYRDAADAELKWFLENARSTNTHLLAWGRFLGWDVMKDQPSIRDGTVAGIHKFHRPWMLWDRCFAVAPDASKDFARALWEHQIANHNNGAFDRHAGFLRHYVATGADPANDAGFFIRTWAAAYSHTRDEQFLRAIDVLLARYEKKRHPVTGLIESSRNQSDSRVDWTLSLAIDCDGAAHHVREPLAGRLRAFAAREDEVFCSLPHDLKGTGGLPVFASLSAIKPLGWSTLWKASYSHVTTAQVGMMCVSRYDNTGRVGYRDLILGAADAYLDSTPPASLDAWPVTFGQAISLQLAAWRHSADWKYMERARKLGDIAVEKFWGTNALPKASYKSEHYETITGADTLALALTELHLQILHITAVRCPPNTIDR